jgi:probable phosphoglycerate mutase
VTTTFFLVRHAAHDRVGTILCGRMPEVRLGAIGHSQARRLAERFANENIATVQSSTLERAVETAEPIAARVGLRVELVEAIGEIDFGAWSGQSFEALQGDPLWTAWNTARGESRPPRGESMREAQARIVGHLDHLRGLYRSKSVILVSHGDVIKSALLHHLGLPLDAYGRFDIDPASVTTLVVGDWGARIIRMNEVLAA